MTITRERIELFIKNPLEHGLTRGEQMELAHIAMVSLDSGPVAMTTLTRHRLLRIRQWRKMYGENRDVVLPTEEADELARIALASLEEEPVAYIFKHPAGKLFWALTDESNKGQSDVIPVYAAPLASERERIRREHAEWSDATFGDVGPIGPLKHLSKEALEAATDPSDPLEWADMQFLLWDAQRRMGISDEFITRAMIEKLEINKSRQWPEPKDGEPRLHIKEQSAPVIPDGWISCSERMPEDEQEVIVHNKLGYRYVSYFDEHSGLFFDMRGGNQMNCIEHILVTHWMPLPASPQQ